MPFLLHISVGIGFARFTHIYTFTMYVVHIQYFQRHPRIYGVSWPAGLNKKGPEHLLLEHLWCNVVELQVCRVLKEATIHPSAYMQHTHALTHTCAHIHSYTHMRSRTCDARMHATHIHAHAGTSNAGTHLGEHRHTHACTHTCTNAQTHTHVHTGTHAQTRACTNTHAWTHTLTHTYACTHAQTHTCTCAQAYTHTYTHTWTHIYAHKHTHNTCTYMLAEMHTCLRLQKNAPFLWSAGSHPLV